MLKKLSVENYVLIDRLDLELAPGLNIITGETGAGKSILLGALSLLLGSRGEAGVMKDVSRNCIIEGLFDISGYNLESFFEQNDLDYQSKTTVRRVISSSGKSRAYINDLPVQLTTLKDMGIRLIDIHSQHQSLMLGNDDFRCAILDSVASNAEMLHNYRLRYDALQKASAELKRLKTQAEQDAREGDYLRFQSEQIEIAKLIEGEQDELEQKQSELSHAEQIQNALSMASELLSEEQAGILGRLKGATQGINTVIAYYPHAAQIHERLNSALIELRDVERELSSEVQRVDSDPLLLQNISERLDLIYTLQKKHGVQTLGELIALGKDYKLRLEMITTANEQILELENNVDRLHESAAAIAVQLSANRLKAAVEVKHHVEALLAQLGMPGAQFEATVTDCRDLKASGSDVTRFMFTANRNTPLQPVEKVASGGEMSRLMLSLKSLVAERSMLPTIIFDEIDAGVSGRIADAMGGIICTIASNMQVINITHLPQVASKGETHFVVYKEDTKEGTLSRIRRLTNTERVEEIAKMLSGSTITDAALSQAKLLLGR